MEMYSIKIQQTDMHKRSRTERRTVTMTSANVEKYHRTKYSVRDPIRRRKRK